MSKKGMKNPYITERSKFFNSDSNNTYSNSDSNSNSNKNNSNRLKTVKKKKSVSWKNNHKIHTINVNNNSVQARKSIPKATPNNTNLTSEERKNIKNVLSAFKNETSSRKELTRNEKKRLRKKIIKHLKEKSQKYGLQHLEPHETNWLNFEATRNF